MGADGAGSAWTSAGSAAVAEGVLGRRMRWLAAPCAYEFVVSRTTECDIATAVSACDTTNSSAIVFCCELEGEI